MTHALYIAVILVLAGVACWLWRLWRQTQEQCAIAKARRASCLASAQYLRSRLNDAIDEADKLDGWLRDEAIAARQVVNDLDAALASNRSLRGWNGRYRRRIAELEEEVSGLVDEVGCLEAELADERGEV